MNGDAAALLSEARTLLSRVQTQGTRFLYRTRGTRGRGRSSAGARASGARKKEGSGPTREANGHKRITRPSWPCAPQCTRRAVACRSDHSTHSLRLLLAKPPRTSPLPCAIPTTEADQDELEVDPILDRDSPDAVTHHPRNMATTIATHQQPSSRSIRKTDSNVSVSTFVSIQVQDIMEKAAINMAHMLGSGARAAGDTADAARVRALRHQVIHNAMDPHQGNCLSASREFSRRRPDTRQTPYFPSKDSTLEGKMRAYVAGRQRLNALQDERYGLIPEGELSFGLLCIQPPPTGYKVMRAATYTAVCRRLEHALQLYNEAIPYKPPPRDNVVAERQDIRPKATISDLPQTTLLAIFGLLEQRDLSLIVAPVCRLWRQLAYHRSLWRHLLLDWTSENDAGLSRVAASSALLAATPGLLKLDLVGCANVDQLLWQVVYSCRRLRTLAVDSCKVSEQLRTNVGNSPCVLSEVLTKCKNLHSLIVAFTPCLAQSVFFTTLGKRCWSMRCFLVSADVTDTRIFFESASQYAPGNRSRESVGGAREAILPGPTTSAHHITDIQTANSSFGSTLLQWRLHRDHADATYFGVNVRVGFADSL